VNTLELGFYNAPEILTVVDMVRSVREFVFAVVDAIISLVAKFHENQHKLLNRVIFIDYHIYLNKRTLYLHNVETYASK
jgi:hypothetical protein